MHRALATLLGIGCGLCLFVVSAKGDTSTETFDSAASAQSHGWFQTGDGVNGQIVGWSNTNNAGGVAGEARAELTKGVPARDGYRDLDIGGTLTANNALSFSGKLDMFFSNPDVELVNVGYSSTTHDNIAGIGIMRDSSTGTYRWSIWMTSPLGGGSATEVNVLAGGGATRVLTDNTDRTFTFSYDPTANGGLGSVSAFVSGAGATSTHDLTASERAGLSDAAWNAFGINRVPLGLFSSSSNQLDVRVDDVTYALVPEPAHVSMIAIGALLFRGSRRRFFKPASVA